MAAANWPSLDALAAFTSPVNGAAVVDANTIRANDNAIALQHTLANRGITYVVGPRYGAKGDGSQDDGDRVNQAIQDRSATGGGIVELNGPLFLTGESIVPKSNVWLRGRGMGATTLLVSDPSIIPVRALGSSGTPVVDFGLSDFTADGAKVASVYTDSRWAILLTYAQRFVVQRVRAMNAETDGLVLEYCKAAEVISVVTDANLKDGLYLSGSDWIRTTSHLSRTNGLAGIAVAASCFNTVVGSQSFLNGPNAGYGIGVVASRDTRGLTFVGNVIDGFDTNGEPIGPGTLPFAADHPWHTGAYDGVTNYGMYNSNVSCNTIMNGAGNSTQSPPGLYVKYGDDNLIAQNQISYVQNFPLACSNASRNRFLGNIVTDCGMPAGNTSCVYVGNIAYPSHPATDANLFKDNAFTDTRGGAAVLTGFVNAAGVTGTRWIDNDYSGITAPLYTFTAGVSEFRGRITGTPAGVISAGVGSLVTRDDGGAGTTLYVKESGAGTAGWVAK